MKAILLVDDNDFERTALMNLLNKNFKDVTIHSTDNGYEAQEILKANKINILITDIKMPLMDGIELVKRVRDMDKQINIIVISGYDEFEYVKQLLPYNVQNYILKPVNIVELQETLKSFLEDKKENKSINNVIKEVVTIIDQEYSKNLTLENISERVFLTTQYLGLLFTKEMGVTFNQYLTDIRLERAKELLETTNIRISDISHYVGINNPSYFNKLFKKKFLVTPAQFRQGEGKDGK